MDLPFFRDEPATGPGIDPSRHASGERGAVDSLVALAAGVLLAAGVVLIVASLIQVGIVWRYDGRNPPPADLGWTFGLPPDWPMLFAGLLAAGAALALALVDWTEVCTGSRGV